MSETSCDIVVIGAGPAGSAAATFLRRAGLSVTVVDAGRHPRHHIGESLLPASMPILERLGVDRATLAARYQPKYGARFYDPERDELETFGFERDPAVQFSPTFQCWRADFDALLCAKAREAGAEVLEGQRVEAVDEDRAAVRLADGREIAGRFLVDASGRAALVASKRQLRRMMPDLGRIGIYSYYRDLPPHDERDADYITMYLFAGGWVWLIPLRDGRTSVGVVLKRSGITPGLSPEDQFERAVATMPRLARRLAEAQRVDGFRVEADYSYAVAEKYGPGHVLVGDAAGFLDPIFSSGVHLALASADKASEGVIRKLRDGDERGLADYQAYMDAGFRVFHAFVERFYGRDLARNVFFAPNKPPHLRKAIVEILAGRVWDATNPVIRMIVPGGPGNGEGR